MSTPNKLYQGQRLSGPRGQVRGVIVTANGKALDMRASQKVADHSPTGFEWGYGGSGPAQLALALILDATGDRTIAAHAYHWFKWAVVSQWSNAWEITAEEIREWIEQWKREDRSAHWRQPVIGCVAVRRCRVCGCTDDDCRQCVAATGSPCAWVEDEPDLCSRCADEQDAAILREMEGGEA